MDFEDLKVAVKSGNNASLILTEVLLELVEKYYCPEASGFDGPETFPDCGLCIKCLAVKMKKSKLI